MVGDADGRELRGEASVGEAGPLLELVVAADAEVFAQLQIRACATREHVVGEVFEAVGVVEVPASDHELDVGDDGAVGAEITPPDLVGALVGLVAGGGVDLVELGLDSEVEVA
jgi:hypothetical protein